MAIEHSFSDIDLTFGIHPTTKDIRLSYDDQSVIRSVKHLVSTNHFERPFNSHIGSNVRKMLFEPVSPLTANHLQREVSDVIKNFEPRVKLQTVIVNVSPDSNAYEVSVSFYIVNNVQLTTLNFILERIR